jgi:hypothetical protein
MPSTVPKGVAFLANEPLIVTRPTSGTPSRTLPVRRYGENQSSENNATLQRRPPVLPPFFSPAPGQGRRLGSALGCARRMMQCPFVRGPSALLRLKGLFCHTYMGSPPVARPTQWRLLVISARHSYFSSDARPFGFVLEKSELLVAILVVVILLYVKRLTGQTGRSRRCCMTKTASPSPHQPRRPPSPTPGTTLSRPSTGTRRNQASDNNIKLQHRPPVLHPFSFSSLTES